MPYISYWDIKNPEESHIPACREKQTSLFGDDDSSWMGSGTLIINPPHCVHTEFLHHQTHVPPWTKSHWWVNLGVIALFPLNASLQHTHTHTRRNMHDQEANSCLPRLGMQMKICDYAMQYKPPSTPPPSPRWQICIICITCSTCWRERKAGPLGFAFPADQNSQWCCTSPELSTTDAQDWKQAFIFCTACLCILLHRRYRNTIQPFQGNWASLEWSNWFDGKLSVTVCMCVDMHLQQSCIKWVELNNQEWAEKVNWYSYKSGSSWTALGRLANSPPNQTPNNKAASLDKTHWEAASALRYQAAGCPQPTVMLLTIPLLAYGNWEAQRRKGRWGGS